MLGDMLTEDTGRTLCKDRGDEAVAVYTLSLNGNKKISWLNLPAVDDSTGYLQVFFGLLSYIGSFAGTSDLV